MVYHLGTGGQMYLETIVKHYIDTSAIVFTQQYPLGLTGMRFCMRVVAYVCVCVCVCVSVLLRLDMIILYVATWKRHYRLCTQRMFLTKRINCVSVCVCVF